MTDNGTPEPVQSPQSAGDLPALRRELLERLEKSALDVRALARLLSHNRSALSRRITHTAPPATVLRSLVAACEGSPVNADVLADAMERVSGPHHSDLVDTLRTLSDRWAAARLMDDTEITALTELTDHVSVPDLHELVEACLPPMSAGLPHHCTSLSATALNLLRRNALPGGLPPLLSFLEYVAATQKATQTSDALRQWSEQKAMQWRVAEALLSCRAQAKRYAADTPASTTRLMLVLFPDGLRSDLYTLRTWHDSAEPTERPSTRGEDAQVNLRQIAEAVFASIKKWVRRATTPRAVSVEFWLPLTLVNEPVWEWCTQGDYEQTPPIFNVVVRSLDRLEMPGLHSPWRERWRHLMDAEVQHPVFLPEAEVPSPHDRDVVVAGCPEGVDTRRELLAALSDGPVVLSKPPVDAAGRRELLVALREGAPAILWHREDCTSTEFRNSVRHLIEQGPLKDLPSRVSALRRESLQHADEQTARGITLLWDDPDQLLPAMPMLVAPSWEERTQVPDLPAFIAPSEAQ